VARSALVTKPLTRFILKEDQEIYYRYIKKLFETGEPHACELQMMKQDGIRFWVRLEATVLRGTEGTSVCRVTLSDNADSKRSEEALRESEEKNRVLFEDGPIESLVIDREGKIIQYNKAVKRSAEKGGRRLPEIGSRMYVDYASNHSIDMRAELMNSMNTKTAKTFNDMPYKNRFLNISIAPTKKGAIISTIDVTNRKQAEEALRKSEANLKRAQEIVHLGHWECDIKTGKITWSDEAFRIFGFEPQSVEITNDFLLGMIHPEDRDRVEKGLTDIRDGSKQYDVEYRIICKDGSIRFVHSRRYISIEKETPGTIFGMIQDITERKRAEEEKQILEERLRRAEKMESIGNLAGGVAHDLNNMLGALIGNAELLKWDMKKTDPLYNMAEAIMNSGQKAATVVQDLLTMARRGVVLREPASLNKIVADQIKSSEIRNLLSSRPYVEIETQYDRDLLDINVSAIHIERVITNLISNAIRAMGGHGTLTIKTRNRYLESPLMGYEAVPKGEYAVLSVSDTGMGISAEHMKNLFEPFYMRQVLKKGGSGLGLSVIWGAMKDHDGYIDVSSKPGRGTTFSLYFSIVRDNKDKWVERPVDEYRGYGETILVVDDDEDQCRVAETMLTRLNYAVKTVESGEEALKYLANHDVDLIVLDMIMGLGIDGYDIYRRILEIKKRQKAIIFSGSTKTERVKMAQNLGAGEFFMKPYVMERLGIAVRRELDRK
jgi:two-component system cell cycle sensor histidine kinase/response regulator CckA